MTTSSLTADLAERLDLVFGAPSDPMPLLERRAAEQFPDQTVIVWEGDATNFEFLFVSDSVRGVLGYPKERWVQEPTFWADVVVHPEDRDYAVSYCALCTGKGKDHDFEYRAVAADGRVVRLHDVVRVVKGPRGVVTHLRGLMFDVMDEEGEGEVFS